MIGQYYRQWPVISMPYHSLTGYPLVFESLKVLEFKCCKIKALKVLENEGGP